MGLFFLSPKITGNVIGISKTSSNQIGVILFIVSLIGGFFWLKNSKSK